MKLLQLSAGQGPAECALAVTLASQTLLTQASKLGVSLTLLEAETAEYKGIYKSLLYRVNEAPLTPSQLAFLKQWQGTMQWICKSPYRPKHGRKNWFFDVRLWTVEDRQVQDAADFDVKTCRASGAGGQHVNTTDSAVQITHKPTGIQVKVQTERSQHQNKRLAWALMLHKLQQQTVETQDRLKRNLRGQHHTLERGNAVRVFIGKEFAERPSNTV